MSISGIVIEATALPGIEIAKAIRDSMELAGVLGITILLTFNRQPIYINPHDSFEELYNRWKRIKKYNQRKSKDD